MPHRIRRPFRRFAKSVEHAPPLYAHALLVFSGRTGVSWLRWLRPGFRHCFVAVDDGVEWLTIDPLLHRLEVRASGLASDFDLAAEYRRLGLVVVEVIPAPVPLRRAPLGVFTCVETAKRLLGMRARWVITPWQLYRFVSARPSQCRRGCRCAEPAPREPRGLGA
jgi:hypothetical protein